MYLYNFHGCFKDKKEPKSIKVGVTLANFEDKFIGYILTEMLVKADVPGIYVNRFPDELNDKQPDGIYYIGSDESTSGVMQMEYLAELLNGKGYVVVLVGELGDNASSLRTEGVEKVASKYPGINIVGKQTAKWISLLASSVVENRIISSLFDAIASNNDEMAIGAIRALEKHGKLDDVIVVGIDATKEAIDEMKAGNLKATVFQDSKGQGYGALDIAFKVVNKEEVPKKLGYNLNLLFQKTIVSLYNKQQIGMQGFKL